MDPAFSPSLAAELNELKRRLDALERSPRLPFSSTRGGTFVFLDDAGGARLSLGNVQISPDGVVAPQSAYGMFAYGDDGTVGLMVKQGTHGLGYPIVPVPLAKSNDFVVVTSGSFVNVMEGTADWPAEEVYAVAFFVVNDASTTSEVRLHEVSNNANTSVQSIGSGASGTVTFQWLHPSQAGLNDTRPRNAPLVINIQARRVSGAGNVNVFMTNRSFLSSLLLYPNANTNGNPSLS